MREKILLSFFEKRIFPDKNNVFKTKEEESEEESKENKYIEKESKSINYDLLEKHFGFVAPGVLANKLYETEDKNKTNELVNVIISGLRDLKDEIEKMSEDKKKIEQPDRGLRIFEEILIFNRENPKQQDLGLKILTPNQMLSRLPITLAQLKAGNNSEKCKNEIRQLLFSLYRSKKLTRHLCKSLIDII